MAAGISLHRSAALLDARVPTDRLPHVWTMPSPADDDVITADNRFIEVTVRWRGRVTDVKRIQGTRPFTIGTDGGDDAVVPVDGGSFVLLTSSPGHGWRVRVTAAMQACVTRAGQVVPLHQTGAVVDGDALAVPLADDTRVTVSCGHHAVTVQAVPRSRVVDVAAAFDALWANAATVTIMVAVVVIAAMQLMPVGMPRLEDDLFTNPNRFQKLILTATPKDTPFLARLQAPSGKSVAPKPAMTTARQTPRAQQTQTTPTPPTDDAVVQRSLAALFGGPDIVTVDADGRDRLQQALGALDGRRVAAAGTGALGLRAGTAGGDATGTLGLGRLSVRGRSSGDVMGGEADGIVDGRVERDVKVTMDTDTVFGSLDPALVRQVVQSHAGQVRYCYESRLTSTPGLAGKIVMRWIIGPDGRVQSAAASDNQMDDVVAACLTSRVRTWVFPKPRGGGIVVVNYPFVFKPAG